MKYIEQRRFLLWSWAHRSLGCSNKDWRWSNMEQVCKENIFLVCIQVTAISDRETTSYFQLPIFVLVNLSGTKCQKFIIVYTPLKKDSVTPPPKRSQTYYIGWKEAHKMNWTLWMLWKCNFTYLLLMGFVACNARYVQKTRSAFHSTKKSGILKRGTEISWENLCKIPKLLNFRNANHSTEIPEILRGKIKLFPSRGMLELPSIPLFLPSFGSYEAISLALIINKFWT